MKLHFTKMHGAGDDFIALNSIQTPIGFTPEQWVTIADCHFGVGTDQLLSTGRLARSDVDFRYRTLNHGGGEVEHCSNGVRCLVESVADRGLIDKCTVRMEVMSDIATLVMQDDDQIIIDMGTPVFETTRLPFLPEDLPTRTQGDDTQHVLQISGWIEWLSAVPMGNSYVMQIVDDTEVFPVLEDGPLTESYTMFPHHVNAGFIQIVDRHSVRLCMHEHGAGETLARNTGTCTAVMANIRRSLFDSPVKVATHGGDPTIAWTSDGQPVVMTGPATTVFEDTLDLNALKLAAAH